jgi:Tol biopolymer transport system component
MVNEPCPTSNCPIAWTPDSDAVLTASLEGLQRIDVRGRRLQLPGALSNVVDLDVSSSGRIAALTMTTTDGQPTMALVASAIDGGGAVTLRRFGHRGAHAPRWSPDGRTVAYLLSSASPSQLGDYSVQLVGADGSGARQLATIARGCCGGLAVDLDWSPSWRLVAAGKSPSGSGTIYEVDLTGKLTPIGGSHVVAWRPGR